MFAEERQTEIVRRARARGRVDVISLSEELGVTPETVRRDLSVIERQGHVRRVHGGAISIERLASEPGLAARETLWTAEKERIAKAAIDEVPHDGAILIDAGTTTRRFAEMLPRDRELLVVVNSPDIALLLGGRAELTVMMLGGRVRARTMAIVDGWALEALTRIHVDVAFMGTNGITVECGLTTPDPAEAMVKQRMIAAARRVVLLSDHTKIGNNYFSPFAALDEVDTFVTDSGADTGLLEEIEDAGPRVVRA
jgi:DeoR family fructose operon transcriptional repressor